MRSKGSPSHGTTPAIAPSAPRAVGSCKIAHFATHGRLWEERLPGRRPACPVPSPCRSCRGRRSKRTFRPSRTMAALALFLHLWGSCPRRATRQSRAESVGTALVLMGAILLDRLMPVLERPGVWPSGGGWIRASGGWRLRRLRPVSGPRVIAGARAGEAPSGLAVRCARQGRSGGKGVPARRIFAGIRLGPCREGPA